MNIFADTKKQIAEAMRARDAVRLATFRGLSAAFTNELVAKGKSTSAELTDEEVFAVVRRQVKQRKDSIEQFEKGGRKDLADAERGELSILEAILPAQMSREEIIRIATAKKVELGVLDKSKIGILVGAVLKETKGRADGTTVKVVMESLFQ